jgi:hypothetical protein
MMVALLIVIDGWALSAAVGQQLRFVTFHSRAVSTPRTSAGRGPCCLASRSNCRLRSEELAVSQHIVMARGIWLGISGVEQLRGVPMLIVDTDVPTGTAVSAFERSR